MGRKRLPPDDPREWISWAKSNLAMARIANAEVDLEDLCFEAQQAAEKGIKAVFIKRGEQFPFSHDLERLLRLLELNGLKIPKYVHESRELTQYAHVTRYPGLAGPVRTRAYRRAVRVPPTCWAGWSAMSTSLDHALGACPDRARRQKRHRIDSGSTG